jgi:hypothetical protein
MLTEVNMKGIGKCLRAGAFILVLGGLLTSATFAAEYDHKIQLKKMSFEWRVNGDNLDIRLKAKTKGWVAVGFNTEGSMKNANLILGYVKRGKVKISDQFGVRQEEHIRDIMTGGQNNIFNKKGSESINQTTISFTIPLKSGDQRDFTINPSQETIILLAYGKRNDNFQSKHEFRTAIKVNLKTGAYR